MFVNGALALIGGPLVAHVASEDGEKVLHKVSRMLNLLKEQVKQQVQVAAPSSGLKRHVSASTPSNKQVRFDL